METKVSIIIPTYNEENTIKQIIDRVKSQSISYGFNKEIIVVDDGSTDRTREIVSQIKGIKYIVSSKNRGKGYAIRTGLVEAKGDIILIQDADLELSPSDYPALLKPFVENNARVVYGSRLIGDINPEHKLIYYFGGRLVTFVANLLYNTKITDEPNGYKLFRRELINSLNLECERFEFCPEVTAKIGRRKIKIYEVPVSYNPRSTKEGKKVRAKDGIQAIWTLLKYRFKK